MVKTSTNNSKGTLNDKLIQLRADVIVPFSRIDIIIKTNKNPSTGETYSSPRWIVYLASDSKYKYITLTEDDFSNIKNLL